jgi:hypothetical protein
MADFLLKKGDTAKPLEVILSDDNGPIDLTGIPVDFKMRLAGDTETKIHKPAIPDPDQITNKGRAKYEWDDEDVDTPGNFVGEFKLSTGEGSLTIPNGNTYIKIEIGAGIADIVP